MLARLECAINRTDLFEQMMLLPKPVAQTDTSDKSINLVVGYNASPESQTALDLTLLIAHQSRLAAQKPVTVQVVYVMAGNHHQTNVTSNQQLSRQLLASSSLSKSATALLTKPKSQQLLESSSQTAEKRHTYNLFKQGDRILSQACRLAEEWQGDFQTHLRFGDVATQLKAVVKLTSATALFLGCDQASQGIVQKYGDNFPCSILGIPHELN